MKSTIVFLSAYKRHEYTRMCLERLAYAQTYENVLFYLVDDGSQDGTYEFMKTFPHNSKVVFHEESLGLRNTIIEFFQFVREARPTYISKLDNDCLVPDNWLNDLTRILEEAQADIISPNVSETNAAYKYGVVKNKRGDFIPSKIVGGVWTMKPEMLDGLFFEATGTSGIRGAFNIINQITAAKDPVIGWTDKVTFEDVGHLGGTHPLHIKNEDHRLYSAEVGRPISW